MREKSSQRRRKRDHSPDIFAVVVEFGLAIPFVVVELVLQLHFGVAKVVSFQDEPLMGYPLLPGVTQIVYKVPLLIWARKARRLRLVRFILISGALMIVLNGGCFCAAAMIDGSVS